MCWEDVEKLAKWVISKKFGGNIPELLGESYLCFLYCKEHYEPEYNNFATYYRTSLTGWIMDYLTYNSRLIHVPKVKQGTEHDVSILEADKSIEVDGDSATYLSTIADTSEAQDAEDKETARWLSYIDDIYNKLTKAEKQAVPYFKRYIVDGTEVPREYRTQVWKIRQLLLEYK